MKKYFKIMMVSILTFLASISIVNAKENVVLEDLLKEVEKINPDATDVFIIGDYAFTSARPYTSQDIMLAARSINVGNTIGKTNKDAVYQEMVMQHITRTLKLDNTFEEWIIKEPTIGDSSKKIESKNNTVSVHYIDYNLVNDISADVEDKLNEDAIILDKDATKYGFKKITYKNHTLTFDIQDINSSLKEYANSGIVDMFKTIVSNDYGFVSITYTGASSETPITKTKADLQAGDVNVTGIAGDMLLGLAMKDGEAGSLTYLDVANKSTTATVKYSDPNYGEKEVTYTLKFTYDVETVKDENLKDAADELKTKLATKGFESVSYSKDDKTVTFEISEIEKLLKDCKDDVVSLFEKYVLGATKIVYHVDGKEDVSITSIDPKQGSTYAAQLLALMAGDDVANAKQLTLGAVAGKSATADVTYTIGDEIKTITYTLKFTYDVVEVKDANLQAAADELKTKLATKGFKNVSYSKEDKTAIFEISDKTKMLKDCKDDVEQLFKKYVVGATKVVYHVDGKEDVSITSIDPEQGSNYAGMLLALMVGEEVKDPKELTLGAVAGKTATADVTYTIGGKEQTITYTLKFVSDTSNILNAASASSPRVFNAQSK